MSFGKVSFGKVSFGKMSGTGNTTPAGRSVFTQFQVFPIFTSVDITVYQYGKNVLYFFHNIAQRTLTEEWGEIFRVDIELYQHGS